MKFGDVLRERLIRKNVSKTMSLGYKTSAVVDTVDAPRFSLAPVLKKTQPALLLL